MNYIQPNNEFFIGNLRFTFYGLFLALGMISGLLLALFISKKRNLKSDDILILALFVFPCAILGARIYYCVFSGRAYSLLEFFKIWEGGLAVYGSIIGGLIGGVIYCLIFKKNFLVLFDVVVPALALGQAIGRIGCFFGGCCYGILAKESLQFFPISVLHDGEWHYATFFYESLWNLIGMIVLLFVFNHAKKDGTTSGAYLVWYGIGRALIEGIRGDSLYIGSIKVSQLLSVILIVIGVAVLVNNFVRKRKENG